MKATSVVPVEATLGAEIHGVELRSIDHDAWTVVEDAFSAYGVLIFHSQNLTRAEQVDFAVRIGDVERFDANAKINPRKSSGVGAPLVLDISNVDDNGVHITTRDHPLTRASQGNEGWHSDSSFKPVASTASVLAAVEVPTSGGDTWFADMRSAYDSLSAEDKSLVEDLMVWHSIQYSQAVIGASGDEVPADPTSMRGAWHPLVSRHPITARRSLFIGRHASKIGGMGVEEGQSLLARLLDEACRPPRLYAHQWQVGDVVLWDNRCLLHRATDWDLSERRVMRHVRVAGDATNRDLNPGENFDGDA